MAMNEENNFEEIQYSCSNKIKVFKNSPFVLNSKKVFWVRFLFIIKKTILDLSLDDLVSIMCLVKKIVCKSKARSLGSIPKNNFNFLKNFHRNNSFIYCTMFSITNYYFQFCLKICI